MGRDSAASESDQAPDSGLLGAHVPQTRGESLHAQSIREPGREHSGRFPGIPARPQQQLF